MIRTKNIVVGTAIVASCLLVSACGQRPITKFTGLDLIRWAQEAPSTPCDELVRRQNAVDGMYVGRYKSNSMSTKVVLMKIGLNTSKAIETQQGRCPGLIRAQKGFLRQMFS